MDNISLISGDPGAQTSVDNPPTIFREPLDYDPASGQESYLLPLPYVTITDHVIEYVYIFIFPLIILPFPLLCISPESRPVGVG